MDFQAAAEAAGYGRRRWYSAVQVARVAGVELGAVVADTRSGRLESRRRRRAGGAPMYRAEWVQEWIDGKEERWDAGS